MNIATYPKEPDAITNYPIDWTAFLAGRTIASSTWDVPAGLTNLSDTNTTTSTVIQLSGGEWAEEYEVTNTIVMNTSESESRSITIKIQYDVRYCTVSEVRAMAQGMTASGQPSATDALVESLIERASRFFDQVCGVPAGYFNEPLYPEVTALVGYGDGSNYLRLPPYVSGTLDTTLSLPEGYTAPTFVERDGYLVRTGSGVQVPLLEYGGWYSGVAVTVAAKWGWERTPEDVKAAVIELAINLWRETDPAHLKMVNIDNQPLREKLPPRVAEIARRYKGHGASMMSWSKPSTSMALGLLTDSGEEILIDA